MNILGKRGDLPFSRKSGRKKEKSTVSFTHAQNIICRTALRMSRPLFVGNNNNNNISFICMTIIM